MDNFGNKLLISFKRMTKTTLPHDRIMTMAIIIWVGSAVNFAGSLPCIHNHIKMSEILLNTNDYQINSKFRLIDFDQVLLLPNKPDMNFQTSNRSTVMNPSCWRSQRFDLKLNTPNRINLRQAICVNQQPEHANLSPRFVTCVPHKPGCVQNTLNIDVSYMSIYIPEICMIYPPSIQIHVLMILGVMLKQSQ